MKAYHVMMENKDGDSHVASCMCGSKFEASRLASLEIEENEKLKSQGFLVIDIKMLNKNNEVKYKNTTTLKEIIEGESYA